MALRLIDIADGFSSESLPSDVPLATGYLSGTLYHDYEVTPVTTGAWVELIASTTEEIKQMSLFDSSGSVMEIGIGVSPVRLFLIPPGGFNGVLPFLIAAGTKVSIRAVSGDVALGYLIANFLK